MVLHVIGSPAATGETLARMVAAKQCSIEDFDQPSPGSVQGFVPRNLLRDWIKVNAVKWQAIQIQYGISPQPVVEAWPSPRDFQIENLPF